MHIGYAHRISLIRFDLIVVLPFQLQSSNSMLPMDGRTDNIISAYDISANEKNFSGAHTREGSESTWPKPGNLPCDCF